MPSDEKLMMGVRAGDLNAFGLLVQRHHQRALNVAYRFSGDVEMSRDVAQESLLRILRAAHSYEPRSRFTTYLYTVVRNLVREMDRQRRRRRESPLPAGTDGDLTARVVPGTIRHPNHS